MLTALVNGRILTDQGTRNERAVLVENGRIRDVVPESDLPRDAERFDLEGHLLLPGFVDVQTNGGGGVFQQRPGVG